MPWAMVVFAFGAGVGRAGGVGIIEAICVGRVDLWDLQKRLVGAALVTYMLLHGSWMHLAFNCIWLLIFGTPVARYLGSMKFLLLMLVSAQSISSLYTTDAQIQAHADLFVQRLLHFPEWCDKLADRGVGDEESVALDERPALFTALDGGAA